jgi:putative endonuclease
LKSQLIHQIPDPGFRRDDGGEVEKRWWRASVSDKTFHVYILASKLGGTLYTGVTSRLIERTYEHRENLVDGFTKRYGVHRLVYYEVHECAESAITREKQIKEWKRAWKIELIERENPNWVDLFDMLRL